ncbi:MAG: hypothetical protein ACI8RZ_005206 [Myxococcota bacterium]|jgi:hypothetical protein
MVCACGEHADGTCTACGRQNIVCPSCGGGISADASAVVVSCPYCDTGLKHRDLGGLPPYFPVNVTEAEAGERLRRFCLNRFGIPGDFERKFTVKSARQVYVPVYLFTVTARLSASIVETDTCAIVGHYGLWYQSAIADYRFAMRVRQYVDPDRIPGEVLDTTMGKEEAERQAQKFGEKLLARDRKRFSEVKGDSSITRTDEGQVFYPLYELTYRYGGKSYRGVVDAANGVVCLSDHPMSMGSRAIVLGSGGLMLGSTAVFALIFLATLFVAQGLAVLGAVGGAGVITVTGGIAGMRILWTAIRSHSSGEEIAAREQPLDIVDLDKQLAVTERLMITGS